MRLLVCLLVGGLLVGSFVGAQYCRAELVHYRFVECMNEEIRGAAPTETAQHVRGRIWACAQMHGLDEFLTLPTIKVHRRLRPSSSTGRHRTWVDLEYKRRIGIPGLTRELEFRYHDR